MRAEYFDSGGFVSTVRINMLKLPIRIVFAALLIAALPGCSLFHKKNQGSNAHLYSGDAPTIKYSDKPEAAGGEMHTY